MVTNNCCDYSPTQHAVQVGGSTGTLTSLAVGASNSALQGSTGADPAFTTTPQIVGLGIGAASTGSGLTFDGSNTMSTYSIGTFTPTIAFGGASVGITYSTQTGYYTKIGNTVYFSINIVLTSKGSSTGALTLTGFPFSTSFLETRFITQCANITFTGSYIEGGFGISSTTGRLIFFTTAAGGVQITDTNMANNSSFILTGFYYV